MTVLFTTSVLVSEWDNSVLNIYVLVKGARLPASSLVTAASGLAQPLRVKRHVLAHPPLSLDIKTPYLSLFSLSPSSPSNTGYSFAPFWFCAPFLPTIADRRISIWHTTSMCRSITLHPHLRPPFSASLIYTWELVIRLYSLLWPPPVSTLLP